MVSSVGMHIGLPVGALHCNNFISPAPNAEVEVAVAEFSVPLASVLLVAVASPVGAATCKVVFVPSIVVWTSPAVGVVEVGVEVPVLELELVDVPANIFSQNIPRVLKAKVRLKCIPRNTRSLVLREIILLTISPAHRRSSQRLSNKRQSRNQRQR